MLAPPRRPKGIFPQLASLGSPGLAIVSVRQSSLPVSGSWPVMKQASLDSRVQPPMPLTMTPPATMGPAE